MREIKFRAWDLDLKKMYYGAFSIDSNSGQVIDAGWRYEGGGKNCIPMQYTGLKDKNGKEIYEGDIGKSWYDKNLIWEVYYEYGKFWLRSGDRIYGDMNASDDPELDVLWSDFEVIGNI